MNGHRTGLSPPRDLQCAVVRCTTTVTTLEW
jgi:hypothetical protein